MINYSETIMKDFTEKSLSVFGGVPLAPLSTLKLFSRKMFYQYFFMHIKNTFCIISRCFTQQFADVVKTNAFFITVKD